MPKGKEGRLCFAGCSLPGPRSCCQLLNHLETAGRLPWTRPRPRADRGQGRRRPGQALGEPATRSSATGRPQMAPPAPVPGPLAGWRGCITSLLETLWALHCPQYRTHMPHHGTEGPSDASLRLPLQPHDHLFVDYSHGVCLAVLWKCQALIPLRFFADFSLLGKALVPWQSSTLTHSLGIRPCSQHFSSGASAVYYLIPYLALAKTELLRKKTC